MWRRTGRIKKDFTRHLIEEENFNKHFEWRIFSGCKKQYVQVLEVGNCRACMGIASSLVQEVREGEIKWETYSRTKSQGAK